ncbi:MAG: hypothetical protein L6R41_006689 [Letrouitia leprolyta]|nr:MAG: hypothetical protein L6R41_006689 [Letrouitia leprolyta]
MATRITRGSAAKELAKLAAAGKEQSQTQPSKLVGQPKKTGVVKKAPAKKNVGTSKAVIEGTDTNLESKTTSKTHSAEKPASKKATGKLQKKSTIQETIETDKPTSNESALEKPNEKRKRSATVQEKDVTPPLNKIRKQRKQTATPKLEQDSEELPHGLGKLWNPSAADAQTMESAAPKLTLPTQASVEAPAVKPEEPSPPVVDPISASADAAATSLPQKSPAKTPRKKNAHPYRLTPGISPFPDWPHPTPEECQQVNDLLSSVHGNVTAPAKIPEPSLTFAGCGEVPCVLDALIRTLLSAATSGENAARAFKGLLKEYGQQETGIGKGSVNWDAVRRSDVNRLFNAIRSGGLGDAKSKNIKKILDMVYEENQANRAALESLDNKNLKEGATTTKTEAEAKVLPIARAHTDHLSLDHLHAMPQQAAFDHMLRYPGIGVKTASCVSLFCLRHPSFAVDTHVFRFCHWLGWVPGKANRNTAYQHCDVRVPEELKYSLHQLLIKHGKSCGRCKAATGQSSKGWEKGCVIDHLVKRTGVRKGGEPSPKKKALGKSSAKGKSLKKAVGKKRKRGDDDDDEDEEQVEEEEEGEEYDSDD